MRRFVIAFILFSVSIVLSCAEPLFTGKFSLNGTMGSGTSFRIDAQYSGNYPCIVVGQTTYFRKNGKVSHIKIYGTMDDEHCSLYEYVGNRVCGHFEIFNMPSPEQLKNFDQVKGMEINGCWDYKSSSLEFTQVSLEQDPNVKYNFLKKANRDPKYISGNYGYIRPFVGGESKYDLQIVVRSDSISWNFNYEDDDLGESGEVMMNSPKFGRIDGLSDDFFSFKLNEWEYILYPLDDVIYITCNDSPDEEGDIYNLSGLFPRMSDYGFSYQYRPSKTEDPESVSYAQCEIFAPRTDSKVLNDSIRAWISSQAGADNHKDYFKLAESATSRFLKEQYDDTSGDEEYVKSMVFDDTHISYNSYEQKGYINLTYSGSSYYGGAHEMYSSTTETLRRSDGKVMTWNDWFTDPAKVRPIIEQYMHDQNEDVEFDEYELPLPISEPYFTPGTFHFFYQVYEACSFAYGTPECEIPLSKLMPYMTQTAKNLVK